MIRGGGEKTKEKNEIIIIIKNLNPQSTTNIHTHHLILPSERFFATTIFIQHLKTTFMCPKSIAGVPKTSVTRVTSVTPKASDIAREASWRRVFDPYAPLLFNLYHYLEQNLHFGFVPENQF